MDQTDNDVPDGPVLYVDSLYQFTFGSTVQEPVKEIVIDDSNSFPGLKEGEHILLACGCEGFVNKIVVGPEPSDSWFSISLTKDSCGKTGSLEPYYSEGWDEIVLTVSHGMFSKSFPFSKKPSPDWFPSIAQGPRSAGIRRYIRLRVHDRERVSPIDVVIPGFLVSGNAYIVADTIRSILGVQKAVEVEVIQMDHDLSSQDFNGLLKKARDSKMTVEEAYAASAHDWLIVQYIRNARGARVDLGRVPVSSSVLAYVLERSKKHSAWRGHSVNALSFNDTIVTMDAMGKVTNHGG